MSIIVILLLMLLHPHTPGVSSCDTRAMGPNLYQPHFRPAKALEGKEIKTHNRPWGRFEAVDGAAYTNISQVQTHKRKYLSRHDQLSS